jgi:hypothetical protein
MSWGFNFVLYSPFWQKIWAWNSLQNLSLTADSQAERDLPCSCQRFAAICWSRRKLHEDNNYRWWILNLQPRNKGPVITMEDSRVWCQKWHKFRARWKWCQQFSLITKALFTISTHQKVILLTRSTMLKFSVGCMMRCGASELRCESEMTGSSTTTHPSNCPTLSRTSWLNFRPLTC